MYDIAVIYHSEVYLSKKFLHETGSDIMTRAVARSVHENVLLQ